MYEDIPDFLHYVKRPENYTVDELHEYYEQNPDVLRLGGRKKRATLPNGDRVRISDPLWMFLKKGTTCINCGIRGEVYQAYDSEKLGYVKLNLYAKRSDGSWVLMTADHTIPRSIGGGSFIGNLEPMCETCNGEKGDKIPDDFRPEDMLISLKSVKDRIITENRGTDLSDFMKFHKQLMRHRRKKGAEIPSIVTIAFARSYVKMVEQLYGLKMPKRLQKLGITE